MKRVPVFPLRLRRAVSTCGPLLALLGIWGLLAIFAAPSFRTPGNLQTIARQSTIIGIAAIGMTLVIMSGGIDLSVGSSIALTTVVIAWFLSQGAPPLAAAMGGIAAGLGTGLIIGTLVTRLKVVPFIVTLGMMLVIRGAAKGLAGEQKIDAPLTWLNNLLAATGRTSPPAGVWLTILLALIVAAMLRFTVFGRHILAVGSSEATARLCGVRVQRVRVSVYALGGLFAGLAGLMQFSRLTVGDPTVAIGAELDVIAAVVIGGGSLAGGEGSILGSLVGALIMTVIRNGCSQLPLPDWLGGGIGLANWVQEIVTGIIIVLAVALDRFRTTTHGAVPQAADTTAEVSIQEAPPGKCQSST